MNGVSKSASGLLTITTRTNFINDVKQNSLLSSILQSRTLPKNTINEPSTLPLAILPKQEIYDQIARENSDTSSHALKLKQSFGYAKSLMKFYKSGVTNVWSNQKLVKELRKKNFQLSHVDKKGNKMNIRIPSFKILTQEMNQRLYVQKTERNAAKESGEVVLRKPDEISNQLFNLTRAQFQLLNRTPRDFYKLPLFGVIFLIFMEMTPLLCYAVPEVTPSTCVLPSILPRMWNTKIIGQLRSESNANKYVQNSYNLPLEEVRILCKSLRITSKYAPAFLYPESFLRKQLQSYYNYLKVDNYYISGLNGGGNVWNMTNQEVLAAALERLLIEDLEKITKEFDAIKSEVERANKENLYFNELRVKLIKFVVDFENSNVGYLGRKVMSNKDIKAILEWKN